MAHLRHKILYHTCLNLSQGLAAVWTVQPCFDLLQTTGIRYTHTEWPIKKEHEHVKCHLTSYQQISIIYTDQTLQLSRQFRPSYKPIRDDCIVRMDALCIYFLTYIECIALFRHSLI